MNIVKNDIEVIKFSFTLENKQLKLLRHDITSFYGLIRITWDTEMAEHYYL